MSAAPVPSVRPRPPAPAPLARDPGPWKALRILRSNPIEGFTSAHFEKPIVMAKTVMGPVAILNHPDGIRRVLVDNAENYGRDWVAKRVLRSYMRDSLPAVEGERWRVQRKVFAPHFTPKMIAAFAPAMFEAADALVARWRGADGQTRDIAAEMALATIDTVERTLFTDGVGVAADEFAQALTHILDNTSRLTLANVLNLPDWFPRWGRLRARRSLALFARSTDRVIAMRRAREDHTPRDLASVIADAAQSQEGALREREIRSNIIAFAVGGHESSANALTWALYLLSLDPFWRARVEAEADRNAADRSVDNLFERFPATRATIEEAMRLYPPFPAINRLALGADRLAGEDIKPRTFVLIPPWTLHRHRALWRDPDRYDPSRFLPGARENIDRFAFLPFGAGARGCIGGAYAMQSMIILLSTVVRWFRMEPASGHRPWPLHRLTLRSGNGMPMVVGRRPV